MAGFFSKVFGQKQAAPAQPAIDPHTHLIPQHAMSMSGDKVLGNTIKPEPHAPEKHKLTTRRIARTPLPHGGVVSTVQHPEGHFETAVFHGDDRSTPLHHEPTDTHQLDAITAHAKAVDNWHRRDTGQMLKHHQDAEERKRAAEESTMSEISFSFINGSISIEETVGDSMFPGGKKKAGKPGKMKGMNSYERGLLRSIGVGVPKDEAKDKWKQWLKGSQFEARPQLSWSFIDGVLSLAEGN